MDNKTLSVIAEGEDLDEVARVLEDFNKIHESAKDFKDLSPSTNLELWDSIFTRLKKLPTGGVLKACLNAVRLLSREKKSMETAMTEDRVVLLLRISGIALGENDLGSQPVEGLKAVFNMIFQSSILQVMFISGGLLEGLVARVRSFARYGQSVEAEFRFFTLRIFFLITALCNETAAVKVRRQCEGLPVLNDFLENHLATAKRDEEMENDILCESLKVTYNLLRELTPNKGISEADIDKDDLDELHRLMKIIRLILISPEGSFVKEADIKRHSIDLLAAIPLSCFVELVPKIDSGASGDLSPKETFVFENNDCSAVESVVVYFDSKISEESSRGPSHYRDVLAPPLCALHNMANSGRVIRKYLKQRILPPLNRQDVVNLPEVGNTLRNKLCSLLTSPVTHISELVANLLFVLCKESVRKLTKYTGYGNAAGLLANKGLMLGGKAPRGKYSDSEEESDTEDYKEVEHSINPVEGRIQLDRPDPMEGMSDEQKVAETMKLLNAIHKMDSTSSGIIKPCRIGPDGRPVPIEHVLQLQEDLENPLKNLSRNDGDSDSDSD